MFSANQSDEQRHQIAERDEPLLRELGEKMQALRIEIHSEETDVVYQAPKLG